MEKAVPKPDGPGPQTPEAPPRGLESRHCFLLTSLMAGSEVPMMRWASDTKQFPYKTLGYYRWSECSL